MQSTIKLELNQLLNLLIKVGKKYTFGQSSNHLCTFLRKQMEKSLIQASQIWKLSSLLNRQWQKTKIGFKAKQNTLTLHLELCKYDVNCFAILSFYIINI